MYLSIFCPPTASEVFPRRGRGGRWRFSPPARPRPASSANRRRKTAGRSQSRPRRGTRAGFPPRRCHTSPKARARGGRGPRRRRSAPCAARARPQVPSEAAGCWPRRRHARRSSAPNRRRAARPARPPSGRNRPPAPRSRSARISASALSRAFSSNVSPVSSTSISAPISRMERTSKRPPSMARSSLTLPKLPVASTSTGFLPMTPAASPSASSLLAHQPRHARLRQVEQRIKLLAAVGPAFAGALHLGVGHFAMLAGS